jgi:hypothetical protein
MLEIDLQGHGKLWRHKAETLKAKGRRELEGERAPRVGEKQDMAATRGMNPFLKADFPARALKRHGQGLPRCAPGFPSYDTGGQASHVIQVVPKHEGGEPPHKECATAPRLCAPSSSPQPTVKKANCRTRSVQPPHGVCPFIFAATNDQEDEPPHKERANAPRLCAPSASPQPAVQPLA